MFTFEEYIFGWAVYLTSAVGLMGLFWYLTRNFWFYPKQCLRLLLATLLLLPAEVENASDYLAPAWIKAVLTLIFSGFEAFIPVGNKLLMASSTVIFIYLLILLAGKLYSLKFSKARI